MADIRLAKPAAGASESVQCAPDARFVFDFPTTDATLAREGDNLNISFQDGSQLRLEGFYQEYNGENLPSFNIDGTEVAAADFFQAMNEPDLMPAAGPGTGTVANGARFHEWGDTSLASGITHLNGLDWNFSRSFEWEDVPNAVGYNDDGGLGGPVNTVPDLDVPAAQERPFDPRNPGDDPNNPASPQNPGGYIPNTHGASIVVDEGALAKGSGQHVLHGAHDFGSFVADVHAERGGSIELSFGGKVVSLAIPQDGSLRIAPSGDASFANVNGVDIRILGAESAGDGKWVVRYEYQLADHIVHDKLIGQDMVRYDGDGIAITVTDGSGDMTRGRITVEVHDDVPMLNSVSFAQPTVVDASDEKIAVNLAGLLTGADEEGAVLTVDVNGTVFVGRQEGGEWIFEEGNDPAAGALRFENGAFIYTRPAADMEGDKTDTYTFTATITDGDNDSVSRTNSITTIAKPKFVEDKPGTPDTEGGAKQISNAFTDDSYVSGGTLASASAAQTLAEEAAPAEDGEGREAAPAAPTNIASGSFSLTMNGQPITVTIKGQADAAITLKFSADGQLERIDGPRNADGDELDQLYSKDGYGHLEVGTTEVVGDAIKVNYTFTQDAAYQNHKNTTALDPESKNELEYSADSFTVTLEDKLGQTDEGSIRVSIHDDAPVLKDLVITSEGKGLLDSVPTIKGTVTALEGADADGATLVVEVNGTTFAGVRQGGEWTFTPSNAKDGESFRIEGQNFTYTRPTADRGEADGHKANEYTFNFTLTDGDRDAVQDSVSVKTVEKPKFVEDKPGTPDTEGGAKQISNAFTDDSYVSGGTKAPAASSQTLADEAAPADDGEGGESAPAATPTNIANGSFSLTMNGQPITVTIESKDGNHITLNFDEAANLNIPEDKDLADFGPATGAYGHLVVTGTKPSDDGKTLTISYKFTQDQAYKGHDDPDDSNELAYGADSFKVTLKDGLDQEDTGSIRVSIHDDAPVVHPLEDMGFTWSEGKATTTPPDDQGSFVYDFGADGESKNGGVSYTLQVEKEGTNIQAKTAEGEWKAVTLTVQAQNESGEWVKVTEGGGQRIVATFKDADGEHTAFTLNIDPATGQVSMKAGDAGVAIKHPETQDSGGSNKDVTLTGVQRVLTVTDGDGDARSASQDITITIEDTAAEFKTPSVQDTDYHSEKLCTALSIDFANATLGEEIKQYGNLARGYKAGNETINIFGTHVAYNMAADGTVVLLEDQVQDFSKNKGSMDPDLPLRLSDHGLGVVSQGQGEEDVAELCVGYNGVSNYKDTDHPTLSRTQTDYHSEGVVIEPKNGTVNYGLTLTLNDFGDGERAIVAFYLTPKNNNDNSTVRYVELHGGTSGTYYTYTNGKYEISVPDGFTKCIIAPIPTLEELGNGWNNTSTVASNSQFAIEKIEFTHPAVIHTGKVEWEANVDGVKELTWDWSAVKEYFGTEGVVLVETIGEGTYTVNFPEDLTGNTINVTLSGGNGEFSLAERTLFTATLEQDGSWKIEQFYKFTLKNGNSLDKCPINFTITDGDGTTTTNFLATAEDGTTTRQPYLVNLALTSVENRFDNVELGAYDKNWGGSACRDNIYDVLQGEGVNDLMYGRGGNDILFGDKLGEGGFATFAKALFGDNTDQLTYTTYDQDSPRDATTPENEDLRYAAGANETRVNNIYTQLNNLIKGGKYTDLETIVDTAEGIEGSQGNDALFGGVGNDILFGGAGDDYLVGTGNLAEAKGLAKGDSATKYINPGYTDSNMLFGGSGRDILVFNKDDVIEDGGDGIDILLMGKKDWATNHSASTDTAKTTLRRLLMGLESGPKVRNIELLLISKNTEYVEQLGITSQASLTAYGIEITGNTVTLDQTMWEYGGIHSNSIKDYPGDDPRIDRYYNEEHDLYLDVLRDGKVQLLNKNGEPFDGNRADDDPPVSDASAACLMDEDYAVDTDSNAPDDGEPMSDAVTFAAPPAQEETLDADTAPETRPADVTETPESFLARVEGLGGEEADILFGSSGNDHLDSVEDKYVFADAGDDLIVYDATDYLIDGGDGIDFLLAGNAEAHSLADMMKNWEKQGEHDENMPMVHDVEVMLKGVDMSLQNMDQLAEAYGFKMKPQNGRDTLELDSKHWQKLEAADADAGVEPAGGDARATSKTLTFQHLDDDGKATGVTLETTLTQEVGVMTEGEQAAIILANSNG